MINFASWFEDLFKIWCIKKLRIGKLQTDSIERNKKDNYKSCEQQTSTDQGIIDDSSRKT